MSSTFAETEVGDIRIVWQMTNAAVATVAQNCPDVTHFRLCIMNPARPDHLTDEPMEEAFGAAAKTCTKVGRLSVAFTGECDLGMKYVLDGCFKLKKLEIRDCPFGDGAALLSGLEKYESTRSFWMSACLVTMNGCRSLASKVRRLNVEAMKDDENGDDSQADKVYVYRSIAGPRKDAPAFVLTF